MNHGVAKCLAEKIVAHSAVFGPETSGHGAHVSFSIRVIASLWQVAVHKVCGMALHHMTGSGLMITEVHDGRMLSCSRAVHQVQAGRGDVVDVNPAEHLVLLVDRLQGAGLHSREG